MFIAFSADVNIVHVGSFLFIRGNRNRRGDCRFGYLLYFHVPLILWLLEISQSELRLSVWYHKIDAIFAKDSVYFGDHFICVSCRILSALCKFKNTRTESRVALSTTASKEVSGKSMALTSMSRYLKLSPFSLYFSFIALTQTFEISIFVMFEYPSSNISSLSLELPAPTFRTLLALSICVVMMSLSPLKRWYQSKGSGSLSDGKITWCTCLPNNRLYHTDSFLKL